MTHAIRIHENGTPDALCFDSVDVPTPAPHEVRIKQTAIGLNFIDSYFRAGLYKVPHFPQTLGLEGAGVVLEVGDEVTNFTLGDRVAYAGGPLGAYCEERVLPAAILIKLPVGISEETAAAIMLKGMTTEYLIKRCFPVKKGDRVLLHAAAGGVGSLASQWLKALGAITIGTAGSDEKCARAKALGCDYTINYKTENLVKEVKDITEGKGVHVVYDAVGRDVFLPSLDCLTPRGTMVTFGNASGAVAPIEPLLLNEKGGLFLTRPSLGHYTQKREDLLLSAQSLFSVVARGVVGVDINQRYPLSETAQAHRDLESRKTTGSSLLLPD